MKMVPPILVVFMLLTVALPVSSQPFTVEGSYMSPLGHYNWIGWQVSGSWMNNPGRKLPLQELQLQEFGPPVFMSDVGVARRIVGLGIGRWPSSHEVRMFLAHATKPRAK